MKNTSLLLGVVVILGGSYLLLRHSVMHETSHNTVVPQGGYTVSEINSRFSQISINTASTTFLYEIPSGWSASITTLDSNGTIIGGLRCPPPAFGIEGRVTLEEKSRIFENDGKSYTATFTVLAMENTPTIPEGAEVFIESSSTPHDLICEVGMYSDSALSKDSINGLEHVYESWH